MQKLLCMRWRRCKGIPMERRTYENRWMWKKFSSEPDSTVTSPRLMSMRDEMLQFQRGVKGHRRKHCTLQKGEGYKKIKTLNLVTVELHALLVEKKTILKNSLPLKHLCTPWKWSSCFHKRRYTLVNWPIAPLITWLGFIHESFYLLQSEELT